MWIVEQMIKDLAYEYDLNQLAFDEDGTPLTPDERDVDMLDWADYAVDNVDIVEAWNSAPLIERHDGFWTEAHVPMGVEIDESGRALVDVSTGLYEWVKSKLNNPDLYVHYVEEYAQKCLADGTLQAN